MGSKVTSEFVARLPWSTPCLLWTSVHTSNRHLVLHMCLYTYISACGCQSVINYVWKSTLTAWIALCRSFWTMSWWLGCNKISVGTWRDLLCWSARYTRWWWGRRTYQAKICRLHFGTVATSGIHWWGKYMRLPCGDDLTHSLSDADFRTWWSTWVRLITKSKSFLLVD